MSQFDFGTINPATKSGTDLASDLNNFRDALNTNHSGTSRPGYVQAGMTWVNNATNPNVIYFYDGTDDIKLGEVDTSSNVFLVSERQAQRQYGTRYATGGVAPAYTITTNPVYILSAYESRLSVRFSAAGTTGSNTLTLDGGTTYDLKQYNELGAKVDAYIPDELITDVIWDGTDYIILNPVKETSGGTWTPTIVNGSNVSSSTSSIGVYMKVGNYVTVSGRITIDTTSSGPFDFTMSLPSAVVGSFVTNTDCAGVMVTQFSETGRIIANVATSTMSCTGDAATNSARAWSYTANFFTT